MNYLVILQAALRLCHELNVLAGESHQLTVAGSQSDVLKKQECTYLEISCTLCIIYLVSRIICVII